MHANILGCKELLDILQLGERIVGQVGERSDRPTNVGLAVAYERVNGDALPIIHAGKVRQVRFEPLK
jgi:hypothetical protein